MGAMTARLAFDLHELDLAAGRERHACVVAAEVYRDGLVKDAVDEQRGHPQRQQAQRVGDRVALGQPVR